MSEPAYPLAFPEGKDDQAWPAQGAWTYDAYCRLPDDGRRYEVIRGHLYVTAAPSVEHQRAVQRLNRTLDSYVLHNDLGEVLTSPLDVLLPREIASPVQPDIVFFRKGHEAPDGALNYRGVPDLIVEVLSPGTRRLDTQIKLPACRDAGVPEVWHVDPQAQEITIYVLSDERSRYLELCRGKVGEAVFSRVLPGLELEVVKIFPRQRQAR
jgi:Uma2 family endonuclease